MFKTYKKILGSILVAALILTGTGVALAQITTDESASLLAQLQDLLQQVQTLQNQLAGLTNTGSSWTGPGTDPGAPYTYEKLSVPELTVANYRTYYPDWVGPTPTQADLDDIMRQYYEYRLCWWAGICEPSHSGAPGSSNTATCLTATLQLGSSGSQVTLLQRFLATDASVYPEGLVTGYFGPLTEAAVKRFQAKYGIEQVGIVGPRTRARINELLGVCAASTTGSGGSTSTGTSSGASVTPLQPGELPAIIAMITKNVTAVRSPSYLYRLYDKMRITILNATPNATVNLYSRKNGNITSLPGVVSATTNSNGGWTQDVPISQTGDLRIWAVINGSLSNAVSIQVNEVGAPISTSGAGGGTGYGGGGGSTPSCTLNVYCENTETGARSASGPSGCQGAGFEGTRQVAECVYPAGSGPTGTCSSQIQFEWRSCYTSTGDLDNKTISSLPTEPGSPGTMYQYQYDPNEFLLPGEPQPFARCSYTNQEEAVRCGAPASGEFCRPEVNYNPAGCVNE